VYIWSISFFLVVFIFLLAYISCTGGFIMTYDIYICAYNVLHHSLSSLPHFLESFQQFSLFYFHVQKYISHIHPLCLTLPNSLWYPSPKRTCFTFFGKCILIVQRSFTRVFHPCILYFKQINPLYYFLFLYPPRFPISQQLSCVSLHHLPKQMQCISVFFWSQHFSV
jgi:hypothetical protein